MTYVSFHVHIFPTGPLLLLSQGERSKVFDQVTLLLDRKVLKLARIGWKMQEAATILAKRDPDFFRLHSLSNHRIANVN